jgi:hypothetical protein
MIYAAIIEKTDSAITVGAYNRPIDPVVAFESLKDFNEYQDWLWRGDCYTGKNLIRVPRKRVEGWFGRDFEFGDYALAILGGISISQVYKAGQGWNFGE